MAKAAVWTKAQSLVLFIQSTYPWLRYCGRATTGHGHNSKIAFLAIKLPHKNHTKIHFQLETLGGRLLIESGLQWRGYGTYILQPIIYTFPTKMEGTRLHFFKHIYMNPQYLKFSTSYFFASKILYLKLLQLRFFIF